MVLSGQAKKDYQREYMRKRRGSNLEGAAMTVRPKRRSSRFQILERDNFRCQYCGKTPKDDIRLEVDHIIPLCEGGDDVDSNLITACFDCNRSKAGNRLNYDAEQSITPSLTLESPAEPVRPTMQDNVTERLHKYNSERNGQVKPEPQSHNPMMVGYIPPQA